MSKLRKFYFARFVGRVVLALGVLYLYIRRRDTS